MIWELLAAIVGVFVIVIVLLVIHVMETIERVDALESSAHALWDSVNRLGNDVDRLWMRIWELEHEDGKQND